MEKVVLIEFCCVVYSVIVENVRIKFGDMIVVIGLGFIGLFCVVLVKF